MFALLTVNWGSIPGISYSPPSAQGITSECHVRVIPGCQGVWPPTKYFLISKFTILAVLLSGSVLLRVELKQSGTEGVAELQCGHSLYMPQELGP